MDTITVVDYESTSAAGEDKTALRESISSYRSGLTRNDGRFGDMETFIGEVCGFTDIQLGRWQSRNNALAEYALRQGEILPRLEALKKRFSPSRIGVVMGSSTASVDRMEEAYTALVDGDTPGTIPTAPCSEPTLPGAFRRTHHRHHWTSNYHNYSLLLISQVFCYCLTMVAVRRCRCSISRRGRHFMQERHVWLLLAAVTLFRALQAAG